MLICIFSFTLLTAFIVIKLIDKYQYLTKEKSLSKSLVYWGAILFISTIFNMVMYINNADSYKLSTFFNHDTLDLLLSLLLFCLVIQMLSPSIAYDKIKPGVKAFIKGLCSRKSGNIDNSSEGYENTIDISSHKRFKNYQSYNIKYKEKNFELLLNALCWLSFCFAICVNIYFVSISFINNFHTLTLSKAMGEQLNHISCIMLLFTLPIAVRQVLFYLFKLKNSTESQIEEYKSPQYEKYMLVQKHLNKVHKRL